MPFSSKSSIQEIYGTANIRKISHNVGKSLSERTTFEAFQSATCFFFYNGLRWVTFFLSHPVDYRLL